MSAENNLGINQEAKTVFVGPQVETLSDRPMYEDTQKIFTYLTDARSGTGVDFKVAVFKLQEKDLVIYRYGEREPVGVSITESGRKKMVNPAVARTFYDEMMDDDDEEESAYTMGCVRNSLSAINNNHLGLASLTEQGQELLSNPSYISGAMYKNSRDKVGYEKALGVVAKGLVQNVQTESGEGVIVYPAETLLLPVDRRDTDFVAVIPFLSEEEFEEMKAKARESLAKRGLALKDNMSDSGRPSLGEEGYRRPRDIKKGLGRKRGKPQSRH